MLLPGFETEQPLIGEGQNSLITSLLPPEYRALLRTIMNSESNYGGGKDPYRVMYGGKEIDNFDDHPRILHNIVSGPNATAKTGLRTSAAGGYQFLGQTPGQPKRSWDEAQEALNLPDFSPESQDRAAVWHAENTYKRETKGRDLRADIRAANGDPAKLQAIGQKLSGWWTSLPGGIEPNPKTKDFASVFQKELDAPDTFGGPALYSPDDPRALKTARASLPGYESPVFNEGNQPPVAPSNTPVSLPAAPSRNAPMNLLEQITGGGSGEAAGGESGYNPLLLMLGLQMMSNSQASTEPNNLFAGMPGVIAQVQRQQQADMRTRLAQKEADRDYNLRRERLDFEKSKKPEDALYTRYENAKREGFKGNYTDFLAFTGGKRDDVPSGFRKTSDGNLEPIPGGPSDPTYKRSVADRQNAPPGYTWKDPSDPTQGLEAIPGGPAEKIPAEVAARIGLAKSFLGQLEDYTENGVQKKGIKSRIKDGQVTGAIDAPIAWLGYGEGGELRRQIQSGAEALLRNLTGAGMSILEAQKYVSRYEPQLGDTSDKLLSKVEQLERELRSTIETVAKGRGGNDRVMGTSGQGGDGWVTIGDVKIRKKN